MAAVAVAAAVLGAPAPSQATSEAWHGFTAGRSGKQGGGWLPFGAMSAGRSGHASEAFDDDPSQITLMHEPQPKQAFAKAVLAISLFRHLLDPEDDHEDDDPGEHGRRIAHLAHDYFWRHWKHHSDDTPVVPEPGTALLLGLGLVALGCRRRC